MEAGIAPRSPAVGGTSRWHSSQHLVHFRPCQCLRLALCSRRLPCCSDADPLGDPLIAAVCNLPTLRHLALVYPFPAAVPPAYDLPAALSHLSNLTTLQLKWVAAQQAPQWLGALVALQHLYLDPYMPADAQGRQGGTGVAGGLGGGIGIPLRVHIDYGGGRAKRTRWVRIPA